MSLENKGVSNSNQVPRKIRKRNKVNWTDREEKLLFLFQMAIGSKFTLIKEFLNNKSENATKNRFYSKLRAYIRYILVKIKKENFFKEMNIEKNYYTRKKILGLVLDKKINTICLNGELIKKLIIEDNLERKQYGINTDERKKKKRKARIIRHGKRGRPKKFILEKKNDTKIIIPETSKN